MADALTNLINEALAHLGEDPIDDAAADPAPARLRKLSAHIQPAIDAVLSRHGWLCALEYLTLSPSADVPGNWQFAHAYVAPEGALKFWTVARSTAWERGVFVAADQSARKIVRAVEPGPLNVACIVRRPVHAIDRHVLDAIALEIAARAAEPINGSSERGDKLTRAATQAILSAMGVDGSDSRADQGAIQDRVGDLRRTAI